MRHDVRLGQFENGTVDQPQLLHASVAFLAQRVPARAVAVLVKRDVFGQRMKREMRRGEGQTKEKRLFTMVAVMLGEHLNGVLSDGCSCVISVLRFDNRERLVVQGVLLRVEIA